MLRGLSLTQQLPIVLGTTALVLVTTTVSAVSWVSGTVHTESGEPVACAAILVVDIDVSDAWVFTDSDGRFAFGVPDGASRVLIPISPGGYTTQGITPTDVLILNNFLSSGTWTGSDFRRVAADASADGALTTLDSLQLINFLNGVGSPTRDPAWIFVPVSYDIPVATGTDVPAVVETLSLSNVVQNLPGTDFLAVMAGDLDDSADTDFCWPCGNGVLDAGEECDDGNTRRGDGCSPGCRLECGNLVIDAGETCDDGNTLDGDGCSSTCQDPALVIFVDGFESGGTGSWSVP